MSALDAQQLDRLAKNSRRSGYLTLTGATIVLLAFFYSGYQLSALNKEISEKQSVIDSKTRQINTIDQRLVFLAEKEASLNQQIEVLRSQRDDLLADMRAIGTEQASRMAAVSSGQSNRAIQFEPDDFLPIASVVNPRADARPSGNRTANGRPIRNYTIWLEVPASRRQEIAEVIYYFNHPTFPNKIQRSSNATNNYLVGYRGWGCLYRIAITLVLTDGEKKQLDFNMCKALGVN